jgi:UDP-N-acetylglucosamine 2-epimerase (non-hydrolysing)
MKKLKVMTIVGTRPEIIRLSRVIAQFDAHCEHVLVHTGQNYDYELGDIFFEELGIRRPDHFMEAAGGSAARTIGRIIMAADELIEAHAPEALMILGDTNSALSAIAAKRRKVPIFHMEAGNRCFDSRVPEEVNRRIVDHVADINLSYGDIARGYLLREGLPPDQVITTGSPMREVLAHYAPAIDASSVLDRLGLSPLQYTVLSTHREENVDEPARLRQVLTLLDALALHYGQPVIVSTHPRTRRRIESLGVTVSPLVQFHKPFGFLDYVKLQTHARVVLSDSGSITEESSILNFPALNLRDVQERPEGFEEAAVMFTGLDVERIFTCLSVVERQPRGEDRLLRLVRDYAALNVSAKVLRIVLSYTGFVNRRTWQRP